MSIQFREAIDHKPNYYALPPTDWSAILDAFLRTEKDMVEVTLTGRDSIRPLNSVYTSINTALRNARKRGKPYPIKVKRDKGKLYLCRTAPEAPGENKQ